MGQNEVSLDTNSQETQTVKFLKSSGVRLERLQLPDPDTGQGLYAAGMSYAMPSVPVFLVASIHARKTADDAGVRDPTGRTMRSQ